MRRSTAASKCRCRSCDAVAISVQHPTVGARSACRHVLILLHAASTPTLTAGILWKRPNRARGAQ